jgi:hypothetical protein
VTLLVILTFIKIATLEADKRSTEEFIGEITAFVSVIKTKEAAVRTIFNNVTRLTKSLNSSTPTSAALTRK